MTEALEYLYCSSAALFLAYPTLVVVAYYGSSLHSLSQTLHHSVRTLQFNKPFSCVFTQSGIDPHVCLAGKAHRRETAPSWPHPPHAMLAQKTPILWPQRNWLSAAKKSGLAVQRNPLSSRGTAHSLCRVPRPWQIGAQWEDQEYQRNPECSVSCGFLRAFQCWGTHVLPHGRALVFLKGAPSSPASELISGQNPQRTKSLAGPTMVSGGSLLKGLWWWSHSSKCRTKVVTINFQVGPCWAQIISTAGLAELVPCWVQAMTTFF